MGTSLFLGFLRAWVVVVSHGAAELKDQPANDLSRVDEEGRTDEILNQLQQDSEAKKNRSSRSPSIGRPFGR